MQSDTKAFFNDFQQEVLAYAAADSTYQLEAFMEVVSNELIETGFIGGFEHCYFRTTRGLRVDGYWFDGEGTLELFIADFDSRREVESLTRTQVDAGFKRVTNFLEASLRGELSPDVTTPEYGLVHQIHSRKSTLQRVNFYMVSERRLSDRIQSLEDNLVCGLKASYHIWDISRFQRQRSARGQKEALDIDLRTIYGSGLSCLSAHLDSAEYQSYLVVMPGNLLADLYGQFGARLLEQNVRSYLQARGKVNRGIRATLLSEPSMFFAYNNGITATAEEVEAVQTSTGLQITRIKDLQIVNGGQTTASLYHTRRKDKISLQNVFVQMKLSVIDKEKSEIVVPKISEYANTQNRVNAADFFSNHPFHIRIEEISRRVWAPAQQGAQRETKWFYERARGQYADAQSKLSSAEKRRFKVEYPRAQMFTKTDLAKFENVWDDHPKWVNRGAQKNFVQFAARIGSEWDKDADSFNEYYFKRLVARAVIFRSTEKLVSAQSWYAGGYRANLVTYTIALLARLCKDAHKSFNYDKIWNLQRIDKITENALIIIMKAVFDALMAPRAGDMNISEWCKKDECWNDILRRCHDLNMRVPQEFLDSLLSVDDVNKTKEDAKRLQKVDNRINAQVRVVQIPASIWQTILSKGRSRKLFTDLENGVLEVAAQIPNKIPSEKQSSVLLRVLQLSIEEGLVSESAIATMGAR